MSPTIGTVEAQALRVLQASGIPLQLGSAPVSITAEQLQQVIESVQASLSPPSGNPMLGVPLWSKTDLTLDASGDSFPHTGTGSFQEFARGLILQHSWREFGEVWFSHVFEVSDPGSGAFKISLEVWTQLAPETGMGADPATRGKPQTRSPLATFTSQNITCDGTPRKVVFVGRIILCGHTGSTWDYHLFGNWYWTSLPESDPRSDAGERVNIALAGSPPFDPTKHSFIGFSFKGTHTGAQELYAVASHGEFMHPREGCGYEV